SAFFPHRRAEAQSQRLLVGIGRAQQRRQERDEHEDGDDAERDDGQATVPCAYERPVGVRENQRAARGLSAHSMTWSARNSSDGGMVKPRAFAVLRLRTSSNVVACSTGRSAGLVRLR